jgi:hypothetical protein
MTVQGGGKRRPVMAPAAVCRGHRQAEDDDAPTGGRLVSLKVSKK